MLPFRTSPIAARPVKAKQEARTRSFTFAGLLGLFGLSACQLLTPHQAKECTPGRQVLCKCADGNAGVQTCDSSGESFGPCQCDPQDSSAPSNSNIPNNLSGDSGPMSNDSGQTGSAKMGNDSTAGNNVSSGDHNGQDSAGDHSDSSSPKDADSTPSKMEEDSSPSPEESTSDPSQTSQTSPNGTSTQDGETTTGDQGCESDADCGVSNVCIAYRCDAQQRCQEEPLRVEVTTTLAVGEMNFEQTLQNECGPWQAASQHRMPIEGCGESLVTLRCFRDLQGLSTRIEIHGESCEAKQWSGPQATTACSAVTTSGLPASVPTITGQCCWPE